MRMLCAVALVLMTLGLFNLAAAAEVVALTDASGSAAEDWWLWPLALFAIALVIGVVSVMGGIGGGTLFVPVVGALFPFHLDFVRGAGLILALAGALVASYQGFADVTMGLGSLILGLGAVIVGESVLRPRSVGWALVAVVVGSVLFRAMIALALQLGLDPVDLKLATALLLLAALGLGRLRIPGLSAPGGES